MYLQKSITLPNGNSGTIVAIANVVADPLNLEVSAHLMLYRDTAAMAAGQAAAWAAKLRLVGERFSHYFPTGTPTIAGLYAAAQAEPLIAGGGATSIDLSDAVLVN